MSTLGIPLRTPGYTSMLYLPGCVYPGFKSPLLYLPGCVYPGLYSLLCLPGWVGGYPPCYASLCGRVVYMSYHASLGVYTGVYASSPCTPCTTSCHCHAPSSARALLLVVSTRVYLSRKKRGLSHLRNKPSWDQKQVGKSEETRYRESFCTRRLGMSEPLKS